MAPFIFWNLAFYTIIRTQLAAYVLIYVGYYFLTVRSYCNIVRKN
ncbi:LexA repressor-like protein [Paenibacillus larvae subsp. larvae DSM 25430]|nr:LexA repressor-like protein [Paenibacillus larvae subsp. larvae DSM 25430]